MDEQNLVVKKSNVLARAVYYGYSAWQGRVMAALIAYLPNEGNFVTIDAHKLLIAPDGGKDWVRLAKGVNRLAGAYVAMRDDKAKVYQAFPIFAKMELRNKVITAEFNYHLVEELRALRSKFTLQDLRVWLSVGSGHTLQLYDLLTSFCSQREQVFDIDFLHQKLNSPDGAKNNFAEFKRRILDPAKKTLALTKVGFNYELLKSGRKITAIKFLFEFGHDDRRIRPQICAPLNDQEMATLKEQQAGKPAKKQVRKKAVASPAIGAGATETFEDKDTLDLPFLK